MARSRRASRSCANGKVDRARRLVAHAAATCPREAPSLWPLELSLLAELGDRSAFDALAARARAEGIEVPAAPEPGPSARALLAEAWAAERAGDRAGARRSFDRARVAFLREAPDGAEEEFVLLRPLAAVDVDAARIAVAVEISGAPATAIFERRRFAPLHLLEGRESMLFEQGVIGWNATEGLLILRDGRDPATIAGATHPLRTPHGLLFVEPEEAGRRLVLYDVDSDRRIAEQRTATRGGEPKLLDDGRLVIQEEGSVAYHRLPSLTPIVEVVGDEVVVSANMKFAAAVRALEHAPDDALRGEIVVLDTNTGKALHRAPHTFPAFRKRTYSLNNDGRYVGEGFASVRLLDAARGRWRTYLEREEPQHPRYATTPPLFSEDGRRFCVWENGQAFVFDVAGGLLPPRFHCFERGGHAAVYEVPPSPGFRPLPGVRALAALQIPHVLSEELGVVAAVEGRPSGADRMALQLQIYDIATKRVRHAVAVGEGPTNDWVVVAVDPAQRLVFVTHGATPHTFSVVDGNPVRATPDSATHDEVEGGASAERRDALTAAFEELPASWRRAPASPQVALGARSVAWFWERDDAGQIRIWTAGKGFHLRRDEPSCAAAFSPDDDAVAVARCGRGEVRVHRFRDGKEASVAIDDAIFAVALSQDGSRLAVAGRKGLTMHDPFGGRLLASFDLPGYADARAALALSAAGTVVARRHGGKLTVSTTVDSSPGEHASSSRQAPSARTKPPR